MQLAGDALCTGLAGSRRNDAYAPQAGRTTERALGLAR